MHGQNYQVFMGYGSVEMLLEGRDPKSTTLFMFPGVDYFAKGKPTTQVRIYHLTLSILDGGVAHYCRIVYASAELMVDREGNPIPDYVQESKRMDQRGESLVICTCRFLSRAGFAEPRKAMPTFPLNVQLVAGGQRFARLDDAMKEFVECEVTA